RRRARAHDRSARPPHRRRPDRSGGRSAVRGIRPRARFHPPLRRRARGERRRPGARERLMRTTISLYALDRPSLVAFSDELKRTLLVDDRAALARLLGLGEQLEQRLGTTARAVDWFLLPEADPSAAPLYASLRRVAKARALSLAW